MISTSEHLLSENIRYTNTVNLPSEMIEFGKYTLKYEPPTSGGIEATVDMSISSEASLSEMLEFFTSFLKASGYYIDENKELVIDRKAPDFSDVPDKWGFSNWDAGAFSPTEYSGVVGGDFVIAGAGLPGGMGDDIISFGSARPAQDVKTDTSGSDVITFS